MIGVVSQLSTPKEAVRMARTMVRNNPDMGEPIVYFETTFQDKQFIIAKKHSWDKFDPIPIKKAQISIRIKPTNVCLQNIEVTNKQIRPILVRELPTVMMFEYLK